MNKASIADILEAKHQELFNWIENQPEEKWLEGSDGKWTVGQHTLHLVKSIRLLNNALSLPSFFIKYKYGTINRELRDYDTVAKRYNEKLIANLERAKEFNRNLKIPTLVQRDNILTTLKIQNKKLQYKTRKLKDKNLDTLLLPHPLMGKMAIREIIMWTAYHTEHHTSTLKNNY